MKIILVTGGNRGIGLEICRQLDALGHTVIMGSRDLKKGQQAAATFSNRIVIKKLDVTDEKTIRELLGFVKAEFGKLDILINNAGTGARHKGIEPAFIAGPRSILEKRIPSVWRLLSRLKPLLRKMGLTPVTKDTENIALEDVKPVMETNFYGPWRMIQVFIPLLTNGRIINISSGMGQLKGLTGEWPGYSLSKSSLNALTIMFSNKLKEKGISVNAMCPGWVRTDMGGPNAPRNVSEGADTAVWLATEEHIPTGKFFRDRKEIDW